MFFDSDSYEKLAWWEQYNMTIAYTTIFGFIFFFYLVISLASFIFKKWRARGTILSSFISEIVLARGINVQDYRSLKTGMYTKVVT